MMTLLGSLFLLLTSCGLLVKHASAVTELTDSNFFDYAKDKDVLLVDFYAPWCSDCKALDPDFENAALNLGSRSVDLAKVDCFGAGKGLCSTYGVKQWPTLKNFNRGQYTGDYTGGLSTADIAGYIATVENSVHPVVNPYAAMAAPASAAVVTQQCVAKCKISRITNKTPCYARCKPKTYGKKVILPQPVINEKSCAKCRQPQIAGKYSTYCSAIEEGCRQLANAVSNLRHIGLPKRMEKVGNTSEVGSSGLPKRTENIMNAFISKPNLVTDFFKQRKVGVPKLTAQSPYEDNEEYEKVGTENTFMHKASIDHDHKHTKSVDSMTPDEAIHVPYDREDKKQKVYKSKINLNNIHVDGVSIFSSKT